MDTCSHHLVLRAIKYVGLLGWTRSEISRASSARKKDTTKLHRTHTSARNNASMVVAEGLCCDLQVSVLQCAPKSGEGRPVRHLHSLSMDALAGKLLALA